MTIQPLARIPSTRPSRSSAPATSSPDSVELGPESNPWPALANAGVLTAASSLNGPIGSVVSQAVREALTESIRRLARAGVRFRYHEPRPLPLIRPEYTDLTPRHVTELLLEDKPALNGRVEMALPEHDHKPVTELDDLRLADGWLGAPVLQGSERALVGAMRTLEPMQIYPRSQAEYSWNLVGDLKKLLAGEAVTFLFPYGRWDKVDRKEVQTIDYLIGSKQDYGGTIPSLARELARAGESKLKFYDESLGATDLGTTYLLGLEGMYVRQGNSVKLPVTEADLRDLPALERKLSAWDATYRQVLMAPYRELGFTPDDDNIPPIVLEAADKFGPTVATAVFAALVQAGKATGQAVENADSLAGKLYDACQDAYELARQARLVCSTYQNEGFEAAEETWNRTQDAILTRAGENGQLRQELEEIFFQLLSDTGSFSATEEGLDLVRVRVGPETQEERNALFRDISRRLPAGQVDQTPACYRTVLAERQEDDTLLETGSRFCSLLHGMAMGRHQERAIEVFCALQRGRSRDECVKSFLTHLALTNDVDASLKAALDPAGGALGSVEVREDAILIGGVRIPRKT